MIGIACSDWFKRYMKLEPNEVTEIMALTMIPWGIKILYGLISDNIPMCGTKRKSYIIIMGLLQFIGLNYLFMFPDQPILPITCVLTLVSFSEAFTNVASDGLMVIQSRKDPEMGS